MDGKTDDWYGVTLAEHLAGDHPINDPRRRYYFYRQTYNTPGNQLLLHDVNALFSGSPNIWMYPCDWGDCDGTANGETLQCSLQDQPFHLELTPDGSGTYGDGRWCSNFMGYWGRHHGNDEGTPPDGFLRTATGVYPSAGSYDNMPDIGDYVNGLTNAFQPGQVWQGNGGGGNGIWPIYLSSYVKFMRAEAYLHKNDLGNAAMYFEQGITESITKVMGFSSVDAEADSSMFPTPGMVAAFVADQVLRFNDAPMTSATVGDGQWPVEYTDMNSPYYGELMKDKMDILGEQYFVAMYGGANDAWNFMRRTGHPRTVSRGLMDNNESGPFPRTGTYPSSEISANPNILQRQDNSTTVFWDSGTTVTSN